MITVFENCRVFDGVNEELIEDASVTIENDRIKEVTTTKPKYQQAQRIDCGNRVLMPGLIDAHFHAYTPTIDFYSNDHMPAALMANHAAAILEGALSRGFTTVRDAAGGDRGLWLAIEQGLINGPRFFYSGKAISQTGGHGDMRPGDQVEPCACSSYSGSISLVADGADAVRKAVREELRQGAHQIKLFVSGGVSSPTDPIWMPQFTEEEIRAAVYETATRRTYVMAHCHTDEAVRRCIEYGVRTIEHGTVITENTALLAAEKDVYVVPTLSIANAIRQNGKQLGLSAEGLEKANGLFEEMLASIVICQKAGVKLGLGTDLLSKEFHPQQGGELALRGQVNSSIDVLRSATSVNAEILQKTGELGCIAPNAYADILVVNGDPFNDLALFQDAEKNIPIVMKGGVFVRKTF